MSEYRPASVPDYCLEGKDIPKYAFFKSQPDPNNNNGSLMGCFGCDFRKMLEVRCSLIPCQRYPGYIAKIIKKEIYAA
jgi:hypothetical protein